jgi:hypothetical protein
VVQRSQRGQQLAYVFEDEHRDGDAGGQITAHGPKAATDRHMRIVASLIQNHARPRGGHQVGECLMILTDRDDTRVTETDEEILVFDVSDDALERTATIIGGQATPVTLVYGTSILGNCACPV